MNTNRHYIALFEFLLILPAAIFLASLVVRKMPALGLDAPAQRIVMWYAERQWRLWLLLVSLPLVVLAVGCATLLQTWHTVGFRGSRIEASRDEIGMRAAIRLRHFSYVQYYLAQPIQRTLVNAMGIKRDGWAGFREIGNPDGSRARPGFPLRAMDNQQMLAAACLASVKLRCFGGHSHPTCWIGYG